MSEHTTSWEDGGLAGLASCGGVSLLLAEVRRAHRFIGDLGMWYIYRLWFEADDARKVELIARSDKAIRPIPILSELSALRTEVRSLRERNELLMGAVGHPWADAKAWLNGKGIPLDPFCPACGHSVTEDHSANDIGEIRCMLCGCVDWTVSIRGGTGHSHDHTAHHGSNSVPRGTGTLGSNLTRT